jgi:hypothetical protein
VIAVIEDAAIWFVRGDGVYPYRHAGHGRDWAWAPAGATFVAGCDGMTTAWYVNVGEGYAPDSLALPLPEHAGWGTDWARGDASNIGMDDAGRIVVSRFFGVPTGCEYEECTIPDYGYSVTTVQPGTGAAEHRVKVASFIADFSGAGSHMVGTAWVHSDGYEQDANILDLASLSLRPSVRLVEYVGEAVDGSAVYGARADDATRATIVFAINAQGQAAPLASMTHPGGVVADVATYGIFRAVVFEAAAEVRDTVRLDGTRSHT